MRANDLDEARARAAAHRWSVERILTELTALPLWDSEFLVQARALHAPLLPVLLDIMHNQQGLARLRAGELLLYLGEATGTEGLLAALQEEDEAVQRHALATASLLPLEPRTEESPSWLRAPVPLQQAPVFAALGPFLAQPESSLGQLALRTVLNFDLPQANAFLPALLLHPDRRVRTMVLGWYAGRGRDEGALGVAEQLLFEPDVAAEDNYWVVSALESYCQDGTSELALPAAQLLARFVREAADRPGNMTTNLLMRALRAIAAAGYPAQEERSLLQAVLHSRVADWRRGVALERLSDLEGAALLPTLRAALQDPILRQSAARSLARLDPAPQAPDLLTTLRQLLVEERSGMTRRDLIDSWLAAGGSAALLLEEVPDHLPVHDRMRLAWLAEGISPRLVAEALTRMGLGPLEESALCELEVRWEAKHNAWSILASLLGQSERLIWFDAEASLVPPNYVRLLGEWVEMTGGYFQAEAFSQELLPDGKVRVQFIYQEQVYAFTARDFGDWYDVETICEGLNQALAQGTQPERFFMLATTDQTAAIAFVPERPFRDLIRRFHIPLEPTSVEGGL